MFTQMTLMPDLPEPKGWVYFGLATDGRIKIGFTRRPLKFRGGELRFRLLVAIQGSEETERMYHRQYAAYRIGESEWFHPAIPLLNELHALCVKHDQPGSARLLRSYMKARERQEKVKVLYPSGTDPVIVAEQRPWPVPMPVLKPPFGTSARSSRTGA